MTLFNKENSLLSTTAPQQHYHHDALKWLVIFALLKDNTENTVCLATSSFQCKDTL